MKELNGKYYEEGRELPVVLRTDVIVAGGGSAGFGAALAAARNNAQTLIIEKEYALGGILTSGLMAKVAIEPYMRGIPTEFIMRLGQDEMALPPMKFPEKNKVTDMTEVPVDPEASKKVMDDMLLEAGVKILYGTVVVGVAKEENRIKGVIIENKNGRQVIEGKVFIDATGDGDLSFHAGAEYKIGRDNDGMCSASTLMFRIGNIDIDKLMKHLEDNPGDLQSSKGGLTPQEIRKSLYGNPPYYAHVGRFKATIAKVEKEGVLSEWERQVLTVRDGILMMNLPGKNQLLVNTSRIMGKNAIDAWDISDSMLEGRKQCWFIFDFLKKYVPGFEDSAIMDTGSILGIRETRRIEGDYIHTLDDFRNRRKYGDAIMCNTDSVEFHNPTGQGTDMEKYQDGEYEEISYKSIIVKNLDNLMVIGRCFSADQLALSCNRSIGFCLSMGQAAGTAAAMAVAENTEIREISVPSLQAKVYSISGV